MPVLDIFMPHMPRQYKKNSKIQIGDLYERTVNKTLAIVTDVQYDEETEQYLIQFNKINNPYSDPLIFFHIDFLDYYDPVG